jgi:hypothetical protein
MQALAGSALSTSLLAPLAGGVDAGRNQKKRRKKKRKNKQPDLQVRADATCPPPQDDAFPVGSLARLAQSFTAGISGDLVRVELELDNRDVSDITYVVRLASLIDGRPGDDALATAHVSATTVPDEVTTVSFAFPSPARIVAGTPYALVLSIDGASNFTWAHRSGNACAGRSFLAEGLFAPFEPRNDRDFVFTTFVQG